jgi:hypothetical protein
MPTQMSINVLFNIFRKYNAKKSIGISMLQWLGYGKSRKKRDGTNN